MRIINDLLTYLSKKFNTDLHYFLKGGFWLILNQVITVLGSLIVASVFTNILSSAEYGNYRYLLALAVLFTTFSLTGIGQAVLQTSAKGHTEFFPYSIKISLLYNLGITISGIAASGYYFLQGNMLLSLGCLMIAFIQPLMSSYQNVVPFLQGLRLFKKSSLMQIFKVGFQTGVSLLALFLTHNVLLLLLVFLLAQSLSNVLASFVFRHKVDTSAKLADEVRIKYLRYAQHLSIQNVIMGLATRLDSVLVFQQLGAANLAVFSVSTIISDQMRGTLKNLVTLLIPKFTRHETIEHNRKNLALRSLQLFVLISFISVVMITLMPLIYRLLFPKYLSAVLYSQMLLLALPASIYLVPYSALQAHLKGKELYAVNLYSSIFQIIITFPLIAFFGLLGAILARIISRYVSTLITFFYVYRAE